MSSVDPTGKIPCVEQPELEAFDKDGDGIVSFDELRAVLPDHERLQSVIQALEKTGVTGIRYTGCGDTSGSNGATEDLATLIARAAVSKIYDGR